MIAPGLVLLLAAVVAALWILGRSERVDGPGGFDPARIGPDIDAWLRAAESQVPDLRPGAEKRVVWADPATRARAPVSVVYVHGFSASGDEIRPVPDMVARALGANLHFTRLAGHGQDGAALGRARAADWRDDVAEALEIGRRIGERVIVIATSTGATLVALALADPEARRQIAGVVMLSPNFGLNAPRARLLEWPFARWFVPFLIGPVRSFPAGSQGQAQVWTTSYPTAALMPLAATIRAARQVDYAGIGVPALFILSDGDTVVRADLARGVAARWGGPAELFAVRPGPGDDPARHVIAGRIMSPGLTAPVAGRITDWARGVLARAAPS